ncbi:MAG: hypothetical protein QXU18_14280 [Thermoplasmatales archaeon]
MRKLFTEPSIMATDLSKIPSILIRNSYSREFDYAISINNNF